VLDSSRNDHELDQRLREDKAKQEFVGGALFQVQRHFFRAVSKSHPTSSEHQVEVSFQRAKPPGGPLKKVGFAKLETSLFKRGVCKDTESYHRRVEGSSGVAVKDQSKESIFGHISSIVVKGDLMPRPESTPKGQAIPAVVHLVFGMTPDWGGKPFSLVHYLCVKSVFDVMKDATILLYYRHEPAGKVSADLGSCISAKP